MLTYFYVSVYILYMTPFEPFFLAKNGSTRLQPMTLITFVLLEYIHICIYIYIHTYIYIYILYIYITKLISLFTVLRKIQTLTTTTTTTTSKTTTRTTENSR